MTHRAYYIILTLALCFLILAVTYEGWRIIHRGDKVITIPAAERVPPISQRVVEPVIVKHPLTNNRQRVYKKEKVGTCDPIKDWPSCGAVLTIHYDDGGKLVVHPEAWLTGDDIRQKRDGKRVDQKMLEMYFR